MKAQRAKRVNANLTANFVGQALSAFLAIVFIPIYVEILGISSYGLIGFFAVLQSVVAIVEMGFAPSVSREMARFSSGLIGSDGVRDFLKSALCLAIPLGGLIFLAVLLASEWVAASWFDSDQLPDDVIAQSVFLMGIVLSFRLPEVIFRSGLIGLQLQVRCNVMNVLIAFMRYFAVVSVLKFTDGDIVTFFGWQVLVSVLGFLGYMVFLIAALPTGTRRSRFSAASLRSVLGFSVGIFFVTAFSSATAQGDKMVLLHFISLDEFGYYALAFALASIIPFLVASISQAYFPRFVELASDDARAEIASLYRRSTRLAGVAVFVCGTPLAFLSDRIMYVWSADQQLVEGVAPILSYLVIGSMANGLLIIPYSAQIASGWTRLALSLSILSFIILFPFLFIFVPTEGVVAGIQGYIGFNVITLVLSITFMHRRMLIGESLPWVLGGVLVPLAASLLVSLLYRMFVPVGDRLVEFLALGIQGVVALVTASTLVLLFGRIIDKRLTTSSSPSGPGQMMHESVK